MENNHDGDLVGSVMLVTCGDFQGTKDFSEQLFCRTIVAYTAEYTVSEGFGSIILPLKEVTWRCSKFFLKVWQNSKENTYAGVFVNKFADWRPTASPKRLHNL